MLFYVYLIKTIKGFKNKSYVGFTNNIKSRLAKHNSNKGAKATKGYKWELVYKKNLCWIQHQCSQKTKQT